jgi:hypothetical protein
MKAPVSTILMVFAFVLFFIAALWFPVAPDPRGNRLIAAGLACASAAWIFSGFSL